MNRIRELRKSQNLRQLDLCKMMQVTQGTLSNWENGKFEPDYEELGKLSEVFGVSIDYLMGRNVPANKRIPVLGRVQAGMPVEAVEQMIDEIDLPERFVGQGEFFALVVRGDSMAPKMEDGDYIVVQKQTTVDNGEIAVVLVNGNDATVKKVQRHADGLSLVPYNPAYDILFFSAKEVERLPVRILGKVVELRRKI